MSMSPSSRVSSSGRSIVSSSPDSDEDEAALPVESLISGREKRTNAGNRLSRLIQEEEEKEDELTLLFEEDEEDVEFNGTDEAQSDVQLDSSSDDDDEGPNAAAGDDDLGEERELQQAAKAERLKKKRKIEAMWKTSGNRKKVKIDPGVIQNASETKASPPKKKVERAVWTSTPDDGTLRSSSRRATVQNKQVVHERMKEHEARRLKQVAIMEAAAKTKQKSRTKIMTQEDRLLEAARTEKINSKSLSRWEKDEKNREAERRAKLAALHRRQMDGPVVTWYSGPAEWINGTLAYVGRKKKADIDDTEHTEDVASAPKSAPTPKPAPAPTVVAAAAAAAIPESMTAIGPAAAAAAPITAAAPTQVQAQIQDPATIVCKPLVSSDAIETQDARETVKDVADSSAETFHDSNNNGSTSMTTGEKPAGLSMDDLPPMEDIQDSIMTENPAVEKPPNDIDRPRPRASIDIQEIPPYDPRWQIATLPPPPPPLIESSTRNLVILKNFDSASTRDRDSVCQVLLKTKRGGGRQHKSVQPVCAITSQPAKYRDPVTQLPYATRYAYQEIQRLKLGSYQWSDLLGCFVGSAKEAAQGVPDDFWTGRVVQAERGTENGRRGSKGRRGRPPRRG